MGFFSDPLYTPEYVLQGDEYAVFTTNKGVIRVKLDTQGAPIHAANFCELASSGFYDDLKFHRYVPDFVIQGGCPNTRDMTSDDVARVVQAPMACLAREVLVTALSTSTAPILPTFIMMEPLQWHGLLIPILLVRNFIFALDHSMGWIAVTPFLGKPSKVLT